MCGNGPCPPPTTYHVDSGMPCPPLAYHRNDKTSLRINNALSKGKKKIFFTLGLKLWQQEASIKHHSMLISHVQLARGLCQPPASRFWCLNSFYQRGFIWSKDKGWAFKEVISLFTELPLASLDESGHFEIFSFHRKSHKMCSFQLLHAFKYTVLRGTHLYSCAQMCF